jgi:iron(III) transport system substrate-binding protein
MLKLTQALLCFLLVSAVLLQNPGQSAGQQPSPNDSVFRYRGADRDARLVAGAKREGRVVLYTSLAPTESAPFAAAFEKKYGIKAELWRALSVQVVDGVGVGKPQTFALLVPERVTV